MALCPVCCDCAEPDRREYRFDLEEETSDWYLSDRPEGNQSFTVRLRTSIRTLVWTLAAGFPLLEAQKKEMLSLVRFL